MKKIVFLGLIYCIGMPFSSYAFTLNPIYKNGAEVCAENASSLKSEFSKLIQVPVDYKNPSGESEYIYAYTKRPFNQKLPTLLFFAGGPGSSSRSSEFMLLHYNVIFFEQRGISCSRPKTQERFLDPNFYSSENAARDAALILDAYKIKKAAIYSHSYGTAPATIFASFFPERTSTLVLEGVVYEANESLWRSKVKTELLKKVFSNLTLEQQERVKDLSRNKIYPNWFSKVGNMMFYLNDGVKAYTNFLTNVLPMEEAPFFDFISSFYAKIDKEEEVYNFSDVTMGMIACQEMSMADPKLSMTSIFKNGDFVSDGINDDRKNYCLPLGFTKVNQLKTYHAKHYPVHVPTVYLLGQEDGATSLEQGLAHFRNVPKKRKLAFILEKGGHLPMLSLLSEYNSCNDPKLCSNLNTSLKAVEAFEDIIKNRNSSALDGLNKLIERKWKPISE